MSFDLYVFLINASVIVRCWVVGLIGVCGAYVMLVCDVGGLILVLRDALRFCLCVF